MKLGKLIINSLRRYSLKILYVLILVSLLPILIPLYLTIVKFGYTWDNALQVIGSTAGLLLILLCFWQYVLGTKSIVGIFTQDVISIVHLHRYFGISSIVLLILHPMMLSLEYMLNRGTTLLRLIPATPYDTSIILGELAGTVLLVVWLTSYLARKRMSFRLWKLSHFMVYLIMPLAFVHSSNIGSFVFSSDIIGNYIRILFGIFVFLVIFRLGKLSGLLRSTYVIKEISALNPTTNKVVLQPQHKGIVPQPGQFIEIMTRRFGESHPFTAMDFDPQTREITLGVKELGQFTKNIKNWQVGTKVWLGGPYGVFGDPIIKQAKRKLVLIAGGIGITPYISLLKYIQANQQDFDEVHLFHAIRTLQDLVKKDFLDGLNIPNLQIHYVLSNETAAHEYDSGYVDASLLKKYLNADFTDYTYLVCGPPIMMTLISTALLKGGVAKHQITSEEFGW